MTAPISLEEFQRLDLRVGRVIKSTNHPRADRLVVLDVEIGSEQRQIVAGIRGRYQAADLVGRQIVVVANLTPVTIRGVESQGMLLAASDPAGPVLVVPDTEVAAGAQVR